MDVQQLCQVIGLSTEGTKCLTETGVTVEMVKTFTEGDIEDVFKTSFLDRYKIRQFLKKSVSSRPSAAGHNNPIAPEAVEINADHDHDDMNVPDTEKKSNDGPSFAGVHAPMDMLRKKHRRGIPTPAQSYFTGLVRDAAKAAKLWKRAAPLNENFDRKKEDFLAKVFFACPNLKPYRREVVSRLVDALQNRRKYLHDKCCGKRKSICRVLSSSSANTSIDKQDESGHIFKEGESVKILSCDQGEVIGKGVYCGHGKAGDQFCELVVTSVMPRAAELEVELPNLDFSCDGETIFGNNLLKKVITWRRSRLQPDVPSVKSSTTPVKKPKQGKSKLSDFKFVRNLNTSTTSTTSTSTDIDSSSHVESDVDYMGTNTVLEDSDTELEDIDHELPQLSKPSSATKRKTKRSKGLDMKQSPRLDNTSAASSNSRACLYEWGGGKVYLGALLVNDEGISVINCMKPIAKIKGKCIDVIVNDKQTTLLNKLDKQHNPDSNYQVCVMPSCKVHLNETGGLAAGHITVTEDVKNRLKGIIKHYLGTKSDEPPNT